MSDVDMAENNTEEPAAKKTKSDDSKENKSGGKGRTGATNQEMEPQWRIRPFAFRKVTEQIFTKRFRLSIANQDFLQRFVTYGTAPAPVYNSYAIRVPYYSFPLDRILFYMDPGEYVSIKRNARKAWIDQCHVNFRLLSHRPYFTTGGTATQLASNTNQPQFEVWEGYKNIMPYTNYWQGTAGTLGTPLSSAFSDTAVLRELLYGNIIATSTTDNSNIIGAIDGIRQWYFSPVFTFPAGKRTASDFVNPAVFQSGLNLHKHRTKSCNVMKCVDAEWQWHYKPTNGLITQAHSAVTVHDPYNVTGTGVGVAGGTAKSDRVNTLSVNAPASTDNDTMLNPSGPGAPLTTTQTEDWSDPTSIYQYGSYIENYNYREYGHVKNFSTPPDMFFGVTPQRQTDGTLLPGITELEIETTMIVKLEHGQPLPYTVTVGNFGTIAQLDGVRNISSCDDSIIVPNGLNQTYGTSYNIGGTQHVYANPDIPNLKKVFAPHKPNVNVVNKMKQIVLDSDSE